MFRNRSHFVVLPVIGWMALAVYGCGSQPAPSPKPVVIFVAASAKGPVELLAKQFRLDTGTEVTVSTGGSSELARQIDRGAAVDLFLSADESSVGFLAVRQKVDSRRNLLTNRLVVVAPADSKLELATLADLADPGFARIAIGEGRVPAGVYARQALAKAGVLERVNGRFQGGVDVRVVLELVVRGECEAGFVYATDVVATGATSRVRVLLTVPEDLHKPIVYPLAILNRGEADGVDVSKFYDYLCSDRGVEVFRGAGFGVEKVSD
jgi:molybdate transport system substrate-binding protein